MPAIKTITSRLHNGFAGAFCYPAGLTAGGYMTKKLAVTITINLNVPDHWEVVSSSEGVEVLKTGEGEYLDLTFEPMVAKDIEAEWSNAVSDEFIDTLFEMVEQEEVSYALSPA
jgi:hypothetical protein